MEPTVDRRGVLLLSVKRVDGHVFACQVVDVIPVSLSIPVANAEGKHFIDQIDLEQDRKDCRQTAISLGTEGGREVLSSQQESERNDRHQESKFLVGDEGEDEGVKDAIVAEVG